jgi:signal peptidase I
MTRKARLALKWIKTLLIGAAIAAVLGTTLFHYLFLRFRMPDSSMEPLIAANRSGDSDVALVWKRINLDTLKAGDLILIEWERNGETIRTIRKIESKEEHPDKVTVAKGRRPRSRRTAEDILNMGYLPRFYVSALNGTESTNFVFVTGEAVRGKVIHVFR